MQPENEVVVTPKVVWLCYNLDLQDIQSPFNSWTLDTPMVTFQMLEQYSDGTLATTILFMSATQGQSRGCSVEYYSKVDESARESHWQSAEIEPNMQIVHPKGPLASATRKYNQRGLTFSKGRA